MVETSGGTWDEAKFQRYGLLAGVVFVALNVVGTFAAGSPPSRDASAAKISAYFLDHETGIKLGALLFGLSLIFGVWWLGSLWRVIGRLEPSGPRLAFIAVVGFVMSGALSAVGQGLFVVPALRPDTLGGTSEFVWSASNVMFSLVLAVTAVHMLALAALVLWMRFLPVWMGWLALVSAVLCIGATFGVVTEATGPMVFLLAGFLSWMLWVLLASVLLARRSAD